MRISRPNTGVTSISLIALVFLLTSLSVNAQKQCIPENQWFEPRSGELSSFESFLSRLPTQGVLLLGEHHENPAHHQWQLTVLKAVYKQQPKMAIGVEMFPQYLQNLLDEWVNDKLDVETFLKRSQWDKIWAYDFQDYLPIFRFARENKIPLIAINAQKSLLKMVRDVGWKNIPEDHRQGITDPAKPSKDYLRQLAVSFRRHYPPGAEVDRKAFFRFVEQQLLWDRAMAEGLAKHKSTYPLMVGMLGSWHIINGFGVPHQLKALGHNNITSLIPWDEHLDCNTISSQFSDAIYGTPSHLTPISPH